MSTLRAEQSPKPPSTDASHKAGKSPGADFVAGNQELVTYNDAEKLLCLSRLSVRRLVESGHIRTVRFGRAVRLRADDIEALIEAGGVNVDRLAS